MFPAALFQESRKQTTVNASKHARKNARTNAYIFSHDSTPRQFVINLPCNAGHHDARPYRATLTRCLT